MLITTECPQCQNRFQVSASLVGVQIWCPNKACRQVFTVQEAGGGSNGPPTAPPPTTSSVSGGVGDLVPLISGEQAAPPPSSPHTPPPVRKPNPTRGTSAPAEEILPVFDADADDQPAEPASDPRSYKEPPPVRRGGASPSNGPHPAAPPSPPSPRKSGSSSDWRTDAPPARGPSAKIDLPPPKPAAPPPPRPTPLAPPVRRKPTDSSPSNPPVELPPGVWDPPPVRQKPADSTDMPPSDPVVSLDAPPPRRRRGVAMLFMIVFPLLVLVGLGVGVWFLIGTWAQTEASLAAAARKDFDEGRFPVAAKKFDTLAAKFPDSSHTAEYRFLADFSGLMAVFASSEADTAPPLEILDKTSQFVTTKDITPPHDRQLGTAFVAWLNKLVDRVNRGDNVTPAAFDRGNEVLVQITARYKDAITPAERGQFVKAVDTTRKVAEERDEREKVMTTLRELADKATVDDIRRMQEVIRERSRVEAGFGDNPEVVTLLTQAKQKQIQAVQFFREDQKLDPIQGEDVEPGLLVEQLIRGTPPPARLGDPVVLALVRGVLYGLSQTNGQIMWAMRVGIDTTRLPLVVPATGVRPEMVLVLSADTQTMSAIDSRDGTQLWQFRLKSPCLGQPVIVDMRAYVPTFDGRIYEIELVQGRLLGYWQVGSRLRLGGVFQEVDLPNGDTARLLYVPADELCVYVLNVDPQNPKCEAVLFTNHASGSLRGEPILAGPGLKTPELGPSYLILNQTENLEGMQLRAWSLPIRGNNDPELPMKTGPKVKGWPWFSPHHDPDKLVLVTDAGVVRLFGLLQSRNNDNPLFPLVENEVHVGPAGEKPVAARVGENLMRAQRAQVALSQGDDLWVLANGWFQKLSLTFDEKTGPKAVIDPNWRQPLRLGSPLHRTQTDANGTTVFTVTQAPGGTGCVATAVDAASKKVLWQRQLGLIIDGPPVVVGDEVLAVDASSGVLSFDATLHPRQPNVQWQVGGRPLRKPRDPLADPPAQDSALAPWSMLIPGADGKSAYEVAYDRDPLTPVNLQLTIRPIAMGAGGKLTADEEAVKTVSLLSPLAGRPALNSRFLLVPQREGAVKRVSLEDGKGVDGPAWRQRLRALDRPCFVTWIGPDDFLTTNGYGGLTRWTWPAGQPLKEWSEKPGQGVPTRQVGAWVVAPPVVVSPLPALGDATPLRVCVADAAGGLTLLEGDKLLPVRRWDLGGRLTAGPFVRGSHVGCVVDRRRLMWFDPEKADPLWTYESDRDDIVGEPQVAGKVVVVADQGGNFVGLDPMTGKKKGPGYTLKANVAPAATPAAFGPEQLFAPLTDGTVLLLGAKHFEDPPSP